MIFNPIFLRIFFFSVGIYSVLRSFVKKELRIESLDSVLGEKNEKNADFDVYPSVKLMLCL